MSGGIKIKVTRYISVRERRKDDVRIRLWTGTKWVYLCWWPYSPHMAEMCGFKPHKLTGEIEFLPPGVVPREKLLYEKKYLPGLRFDGIVR